MLYLIHYGRGTDGSVKVTVFSEDGSQLIQREFMAYEIVEEEPLEIRFPEVLPLAEHVLKIEIEGNATEGSSFFLWASDTAAVWIYWGIACCFCVNVLWQRRTCLHEKRQ